MRRTRKIFLFGSATLWFLWAFNALADGPSTPDQVVQVFDNIAFWIGNIFWMWAAASAFYAGYLYIWKGGSDDISTAHRQLWYTMIAIIIGIMVSGLPTLIKGIITP